jgi:Fibronectin type III domain
MRTKTVAALALSVFWLLGAAAVAAAQAPDSPAPSWPTLKVQLTKDHVSKGSALEALILKNQDFTMLSSKEANDKIGIPLWLRVNWRKAHPEMKYDSADPTGGYPLVLREAAEWMLSHQDLEPGKPEPDLAPGEELSTTAGPNLRISGSQSAPRSESDIRINFNSPLKVISASNNISSSGMQAQYYSTDGGSTWGQTTLSLVTGDAFHSDPTVDWTSDGTAWSTTIGINSSATQLRMRAYKSTNNGATWTFDNTFSGSQTSSDKELIWVDHSASSSFKDNIYACWHNGNPQYVNRRTGPGGSWGTPLQISGSESTGTAIGCDVKTNSSGDVFVFWPTTGNRKIFVGKSTNGGVSFATPVQVATTYGSFDIGVPAFNSRRMLIYATAGAYRTGSKNNVYVAWNDLSGDSGCTSASQEPGSSTTSTCKTRIWFSRSTNGGTSWSTPVKINNQAGLNDQFNPGLAVDESSGRVSVIYYDTVADSGRKKTDIWYQTSDDDGATWSSAFKVTTAQTDETVSGADSGNQYGDYNALTGYAGNFLPSWTDRRNNAHEEIWTANLSESPCSPPAAPGGLTATAVSSSQINLSWSSVSGATAYHVERSTTSGGPYSQVGSTSGTTFSDTGLSPSTTYYYVVRSFNGCESANSSQASATTQAGGGCTTATLYSNGFESGSGLSDWTRGSFVSGGSVTSWRGIQTCTAQTGSKIFRYGGTSCTANYTSNDFNYAQPGGSSGIAVPAGATLAKLTFGHRSRFESGYDGGTLTLSLDGSTYYFIPATALSGASYNGTISASCPPAGAAGTSVFTGAQTSFVTTTVDLDAMCNSILGGSSGCAGQSLRIGFTTITDCSVTDDGWFLDNVTVTACVP